jgi:hypothetical protein
MIRFAMLIVLVGFSGYPPAIGQAKQDMREQDLQNERRKLEKERDPEDRAESFMKVADIALSYLSEAASTNDAARVESYAELYQQTVTDARDEMMKSGLDPYKKPKGYKTIETAVRKQVLVLRDIALRLNVETRKPVETVMGAAKKVRDEVLKVLFR